jgi:hypothetical protein
MFGHLHREDLRKAPHRPLARTVMRQERERLQCRNRCRANDFITRARSGYRALSNHLLRSQSVAVPDAHKVDFEHLPDILFRDLQHSFHLRDAGISYHDGQGPELFDGPVDHGLDFGGFGHVGNDADGRAFGLGVEFVATSSSMPALLAETSFMQTK